MTRSDDSAHRFFRCDFSFGHAVSVRAGSAVNDEGATAHRFARLPRPGRGSVPVVVLTDFAALNPKVDFNQLEARECRIHCPIDETAMKARKQMIHGRYLRDVGALLKVDRGPSLTWAVTGTLFALMAPATGFGAGDVALGRQHYADHCRGCHGDQNMSPTVGPSLKGVFGRKSGTEYKGVHSQALLDANVIWNEGTLRKFLAAPAKQLPGTYMPGGHPDAERIEHIIAYLRTLH